MAKVVTQTIPSENRLIYKRAAQIATTLRGQDYVRTRYPWRIPKMQAGGSGVKPAQKVQRDRFIYVKNKYALLTAADKARWVAANPEYHSYLYGYNFFMLEGLMGGGTVEYPQMIKSIQVMKASVPTTGGHAFTLPVEVDSAKTVVMIQGSAIKVPLVLRGSGSIATGGTTLNIGTTVDPDKCTVKLFGTSEQYDEVGGYPYAWSVYPYVSSLSATQIGIAWSTTPEIAATVSWEITEHFEGVVHPVLVSVTNTTVTIDWAETPDAAADVSITAVEYL